VLGKSSRTFHRGLLVVGALLLLTAGSLLSPISAAAANTVASPALPAPFTGMMVPLYTMPNDSSWAALIQAKTAFPNVPIVAIVNPQSGPGTNMSSAYLNGITDLQAAGIVVLGYVATGYGTQPITLVEHEVSEYWSWYHVNGTMFDQMPTASGYQYYYIALNAYVKELGMNYTVGNPGLTIAPSYIGILDTLIIYENSGLPNATAISGLYGGYTKSNFAVISYGVSAAQQSSALAGISSAVSYVYFTNAIMPNPYHSLPSYLISELASLNIRRR
jgi:hypothetical protein